MMPPARRSVVLAVAGLTLLGVVLRLARLDQSLMGDELSTLWIVSNNDLPDTVSIVATDAEISPPLSFILSWLAAQLGSAPELVRLPALIAGTISIPLTYMVGRRAVGQTAGLLAAAVMALSPFMIFYSTDGRSYALAIALLLGSTLAMLTAVGDGRRRWWVLYGLLTCLAMYTHYTAAFVLFAQFLWLLWAHPQARKPALVANVVAAVAFLPWLPSALEDSRSPTIDLLAFLQGSGFEVKRAAVEVWAFGYPYVGLDDVPGHPALLLAICGLAVAVAAAVIRSRAGRREGGPWISKGMVLVLLLALATPVAEALILLLGGTDLFGARNLNTSSAGLALSIGAILAAAGPVWGVVAATAVFAAYGIGSVGTLDAENGTVDLEEAAAFVEAEAQPADVIVDQSLDTSVTPVPLTGLDVHLDEREVDFHIKLPSGDPPFLPFLSRTPSPAGELRDAFDTRGDERVILVGPPDAVVREGDEVTGVAIPDTSEEPAGVLPLPPASTIVAEREFPGAEQISVFVIQLGPERG